MIKNLPISIILNVHNEEQYLEECLRSIFEQSFENFELLLTLDGCTDNSKKIVQYFNDDRVKIIENETKKGVSICLNHSISKAKGKYIVRMDGDDIMFNNRLSKQFAFMEQNVDIGVCSSWIERIGSVSDIIKHSYDDSKIKIDMLFGNPISHPSVIMKKSLFEDKNINYKPEYDVVEDYKLWTELAFITKISNIPEVLLRYRTHDDQMSNTENQKARNIKVLKIKKTYFEKIFFKLEDESVDIWCKLFNYNESLVFQDIAKGLKFIDRIRNSGTTFFNTEDLYQIIFNCQEEIFRAIYSFGDQLYQIENENKKLNTKNSSLLNQIEKISLDRENILKKTISIKQKNNEILQQILVRSEETNQLILATEENNKTLQKMLTKKEFLEEEKTKLTNELISAIEKKNKTLLRINILEEDIKGYKLKIQSQEATINSKSDDVSNYFSKNKSLTKKIELLSQEIKTNESIIKDISTKNKNQTDKTLQLKQEYIEVIEQLKSKYEIKTIQYKALEGQTERYRNKVIELKIENKTFQELIQKMRIKNRLKKLVGM